MIFVDRISSAVSNYAYRVGEVWWVYAFALGAVAAFNPCGFALVPAYLGLYLRDDMTRSGVGVRLLRSVRVAVVVGASFTALFGGVGALFSLGSALVARSLPWIGPGIGIVLVLVGGLILSGRSVAASLPQRVAAALGKRASTSDLRGYAAFGEAYGAVSLGCTLPLFLALMGTATVASGRWSAPIGFVLYGAGMATALGVLTLAAGVVSFGTLRRVRGSVRMVSTLSAGLLLLSGAYVVYHWLTAGGCFSRDEARRLSGAPWISTWRRAGAGRRRAPRRRSLLVREPRCGLEGAGSLEDGQVLRVSTVVWCTGFGHDFSRIDLPILDPDGMPRHRRGMVEHEPGLYVLGSPFLYGFTSALIAGAGRDAAFVVDEIAARSRADAHAGPPSV